MITARVSFVVLVSMLWLLGAACASGGGAGGASTGDSTATAGKPAYPAGYSAPAAGSPLSKITAGMTEAEVRKILGEPDNSNNYMSGKAWNPFYFGSDTGRSDWMYKGKGRVVFSRHRWNGSLKVIRAMANPNEP